LTPEIAESFRVQGRDPNKFRQVSFDKAVEMAKLRSITPGKNYYVPAVHEWLAGLVLALSLGDSPIGDAALNSTLKRSYLEGVHEWVDLQYGTYKRVRYLFGPASGDQNRWIMQRDRDSGSGPIGVRFVRDP
jgi:hypothetical protein